MSHFLPMTWNGLQFQHVPDKGQSHTWIGFRCGLFHSCVNKPVAVWSISSPTIIWWVAQHFLIPQVENILATNSMHDELGVGTIILWSLRGSDLTTCHNSPWAIVKAKTSQLHPTTAEDLRTAFWDGFNDVSHKHWRKCPGEREGKI